MSIKTSLELIIVIGGVIGMIWGGLTFVQSRTEAYHDDQMAPVVETLTNVDQGITIDRILSLLEARCDLLNQDRDTSHLEAPLEAQLTRYLGLTEREFPVGSCQDGRRVR